MPWALQSERSMFEFHSFIYRFNKYLLHAYYVPTLLQALGYKSREGANMSAHFLIGEAATTIPRTHSRLTQPYAKLVVKVLPPCRKNFLLCTALWGQAQALENSLPASFVEGPANRESTRRLQRWIKDLSLPVF